MIIKALSIREPWASAIVDGHKNIEIRYWQRSPNLVLPEIIAIHASKTVDQYAFDYFRKNNLPCNDNPQPGLGSVIGIAELVRLVVYRSPAHFESDFGKHLNAYMIPEEHRPKRKCLGLCFRDQKRIKPKLVTGRLGFFNVDI